ncbi:MAG: RNA 2',3'-cyclic phosphodiesterase [Candidatus Delongbacteria bacterium]
MTRRLFIALALPEEIRAELGRTRDQLASRRDRINWLPREQLHLTLRFLGDVEEAEIPALDAQLEELAARHAPLELKLGLPGIFGPPAAPRVLWVGLAGWLEPLERLVRELESRLRRLGRPPAESGFKPHLTLGRVKQCRADLAAAHLAFPPLPLALRLGHLQLIESRLRPAGAEHHVLTRHILSGNEREASTAE